MSLELVEHAGFVRLLVGAVSAYVSLEGLLDDPYEIEASVADEPDDLELIYADGLSQLPEIYGEASSALS